MKLTNSYVQSLPPGVYDETPKSVWAALAVSLCLQLNEEDWRSLPDDIRAEWKALYDNGIVPQRPRTW